MPAEHVAELARVPDEQAPEEHDPFCYGWRFVRRVHNGHEEWEQVPLTLDDVLHPQMGDYIVHKHYHILYCTYLHAMLTDHLKHDQFAVVLGDVQVDLSLPGVRPICPDIAVILGVRQQQDWSTFSVAEEGVAPALVIEVTSPKTRHHDIGSSDPTDAPKYRWYTRAGVGVYLVIDYARQREGHPPPLYAFQRTEAGTYTAISPNAHGHLWLAPVGLALGQRGDGIALYDAEGHELPDLAAMRAARDAAYREVEEARQRAEEAERKLQSAEQRIAELEAQVRTMQAGGGNGRSSNGDPTGPQPEKT
jgi:colicin import membrane protein